MHWQTYIHEIIGLIGVSMILITYYLLQSGRLKSISFSYSILNLIGSILILYSLFFDWNLPAAVVEIAWIAISIYGIFKAFYSHRKIQAVEMAMDDKEKK